MQIFEKINDLHKALAKCRQAGQLIGLVPTMGDLHEGHLSLIDTAREKCQFVLATIFVNPLQFGPEEDLDNYPRTLDSDCSLLESKHCDGIFVPSALEMYPLGNENQTLVKVPGLSERHCGISRPGHFDGVCTIVSKLFNLTKPDMAFFGEKDYQQLQIIKKMSADLCMDVEIIGVPTVRTPNGLAMSSRNSYLNDQQFTIASALRKILQETTEKITQGEINFPALELEASESLNSAGLKVDYFNISHAETLEPAGNADSKLVILASVWLGETRLIDNIEVQLEQ